MGVLVQIAMGIARWPELTAAYNTDALDVVTRGNYIALLVLIGISGDFRCLSCLLIGLLVFVITCCYQPPPSRLLRRRLLVSLKSRWLRALL
jgi:hypothetical protein